MKNKGLLVISFGTSFPETRQKTIHVIEQDLHAEFPDRTFYHAFSSRMIVRKLRGTEQEIDSVEDAISRILADGITDLLVQPTHLMQAIEYERIVSLFEACRDQFEALQFGKPLLSSAEDLQAVADRIPEMYPFLEDPGNTLVLLGHGTEHKYNQVYQTLNDVLAEKTPNVLIGTVEAVPTLDDIVARLIARRETTEINQVYLAPLLIVAGDHATNDMASDDEDSWKSQISAADFDVTCVLKGLGEYPEIRELYVQHAHAASDL